MHSDTGHLLDVSNFNVAKVDKIKAEGYKEVPESHRKAAAKKLAGKKEAHVSLTSGGKLSMLCSKWREEKRSRYIKKIGSSEINRRRESRRKKNAKVVFTNSQPTNAKCH